MLKCMLITTGQRKLLRFLLLFSPIHKLILGYFLLVTTSWFPLVTPAALRITSCRFSAVLPVIQFLPARNMRRLNLHTSCNSNLYPSNRNGACWSAALPTVWRRVTACVLVIQCRTSADAFDDDDDVVLQTPEMKVSVKWGQSMRMWSFIGVCFFLRYVGWLGTFCTNILLPSKGQKCIYSIVWDNRFLRNPNKRLRDCSLF